jgi:GAF domain-containing protein
VLAHASPAKEAMLHQIWPREWSKLPDQHPISECLKKRAPIILNQCPPSVIDGMTTLPEQAEIVRKVGVRSLLVVPLVAHGTVVGGFMLVSSQARRRAYDEPLLNLVCDLARSYAQAIYNARLFVETRLALRLRDEVILSTRHELLEMVAGLKDRRGKDRGRMSWPIGTPNPAAEQPHPRPQQRNGEMSALLADMERIAHRLGALVDPYGGRA